MAYFGGGGVTGALHPSLQTYIDCFLSPPWPKQFPRGGGIWDQDPVLIRDFRTIMNFEREWKDAQDRMESFKQGDLNGATGASSGGGGGGLGNALEGYLDSLGEDGRF